MRPARNTWNLTASAPASAATSIRRRALSRLPLWFDPASAMTKQRPVWIHSGMEHLQLGDLDARAPGLAELRGDEDVGEMAVLPPRLRVDGLAGHGGGERGDLVVVDGL